MNSAANPTPFVLDPVAFGLSDAVQKPTGQAGQLEASGAIWRSIDDQVEVGIWECGPGVFTATRDGYDEMCQILSGSATVTPEGEDPIELTVGSILITPNQWRGVWNVHETLRKTYVTYGRKSNPNVRN